MCWRTCVQVFRANLHRLQRAGQSCSRVARASWKKHIQNKLRRSRCIPREEGKLGLHLGDGMDAFLSSCCTRHLSKVTKNPLKIHISPAQHQLWFSPGVLPSAAAWSWAWQGSRCDSAASARCLPWLPARIAREPLCYQSYDVAAARELHSCCFWVAHGSQPQMERSCSRDSRCFCSDYCKSGSEGWIPARGTRWRRASRLCCCQPDPLLVFQKQQNLQ